MGNMNSVKGKNRIGHGHTHRATALLSGLYNPPISAPLFAFFCNMLLLPISILQIWPSRCVAGAEAYLADCILRDDLH